MIESLLYHSIVEMIPFKYIKMQIKTRVFGVASLCKERNILLTEDTWLTLTSKSVE
jgi:hypothetical protein